MRVSRFYTDHNFNNNYADFFSKRLVDISLNNNSVFKNLSIESPKDWSYDTISYLSSMLFCENKVSIEYDYIKEYDVPSELWCRTPTFTECSVDKNENLSTQQLSLSTSFSYESSLKDVFHRMAGSVAYWALKLKYIDADSALILFDELRYMLLHQIFSPSKAHWLRLGIGWYYGTLKNEKAWYSNNILNIISQFDKYQLASLSTNQDVASQFYRFSNAELSLFSDLHLSCKADELPANQLFANTQITNLQGINVDFSYEMSLKNPHNINALINNINNNQYVYEIINSDVLDINYNFNFYYTSAHDADSLLHAKLQNMQDNISSALGYHIVNIYLKDMQHAINSYQQAVNIEDHYYAYNNKHNMQLLQVIEDAKISSVTEEHLKLFAHDNSVTYNMSNDATESNVHNTTYKLELYHQDSYLLLRNDFIDEENSVIHLYSIMNYVLASHKNKLMFIDNTDQYHLTLNNDVALDRLDNNLLTNTASFFGAINLLSLVKDGDIFNCNAMQHIVRLSILFLEVSLNISSYPSLKILMNTERLRPLALSYNNLGELMLVNNISYYSQQGVAFATLITSLFTAYSYLASAEIAKNNQSYALYNTNKQGVLNTVKKYCNLIYAKEYESQTLHKMSDLLVEARLVWDTVFANVKQFGLRHGQLTKLVDDSFTNKVLAVNTSMYYPSTKLISYQKDDLGVNQRAVNANLRLALTHLGYTSEQIQSIYNYLQGALFNNVADNEMSVTTPDILSNTPYINRASLKAKQFSDEVINEIEKVLPMVSNIRFCFSLYVVGVEFCKEILNIDVEKLYNPGFCLLTFLGFSQHEIDSINVFLYGNDSLQYAQHLLKSVNDLSVLENPKYITDTEHLDYYLQLLKGVQNFITGFVHANIFIDLSYLDVNNIISVIIKVARYGLKSVAIAMNNKHKLPVLPTSWSKIQEYTILTNATASNDNKSFNNANILNDVGGNKDQYSVDKHQSSISLEHDESHDKLKKIQHHIDHQHSLSIIDASSKIKCEVCSSTNFIQHYDYMICKYCGNISKYKNYRN